MWDYLKLLDLRGENRVQVVYDYLWDRWGIGIGTFRVLPILACFLISQLYYAVPGNEGKGTAAFSPGMMAVTTVIAAVILFFLITSVINENYLQREGFYETLNAQALAWSGEKGFDRRVFHFVLFTGIWAFLSIFDGNWAPYLWGAPAAVCCMWGYAVKVRERDEERFKQHDLAMQGSM